MEISCGIAPSPKTTEHAKLAEDLGYDRVWLFDSAAVYEDVWMHLALCAKATERVGLGTAVLVPHLRHVMATASAVATMESLAPGRLALGFGTGASARWCLGQSALTWNYLLTYIEQLRGLLRGEVVTIDGKRCQMMHFRTTVERPIEVPILISAMGPKGQKLTQENADGIFGIGGGDFSMDWQVQMMNGTVLNESETLGDERVKLALGPWYLMMYHGAYQTDSAAADGLPGGAEWRAGLEAERPEGERHLVVHEGHVTEVTDRDMPLIDAAGDTIGALSWVGSPDEMRAKADEAAAAGTTELLYTPAGPDVARELQAMADALI